ncbi:MAG TPA: metal-dependent hydrolase [bacterium]|nr:metal-dependent hydrolase [bacterium]
MFIGHYAVGFGARGSLRARPGAPSLGTWFLAVQWLDLVWPILVVTGIERLRVVPGDNPFLYLDFTHYPWTHSLLAALVWAVLFGAVYRWRTGDGRNALWLGGGVFSHWVLDLIVHVPDLPLYPGSSVRVGLGLWHSVPGTLIVEGALFVLGLAWYLRRTRALDGVGRWALWGLVAFLLAAYVASLLGPPPPSAMMVGASALLLWVLVPWAYWIDRHRVPAA